MQSDHMIIILLEETVGGVEHPFLLKVLQLVFCSVISIPQSLDDIVLLFHQRATLVIMTIMWDLVAEVSFSRIFELWVNILR